MIRIGVLYGLLGVGLAAAAVLVARGVEAGRTLGFVVAGMACWSGLGELVWALVQPAPVGVYVFPPVAVGALGLAVILLLAKRYPAGSA